MSDEPHPKPSVILTHLGSAALLCSDELPFSAQTRILAQTNDIAPLQDPGRLISDRIAVQPAKRFRYSEGDIPRWRMNARRIRSSSPNPARRATSTTPLLSLLSSNSRAVSTRSASTPEAGVIPVRLAEERAKGRGLMPAFAAS